MLPFDTLHGLSREILGLLASRLHPTEFWLRQSSPDKAYSHILPAGSSSTLLGLEPYSSLWTSKPHLSDTLNITIKQCI